MRLRHNSWHSREAQIRAAHDAFGGGGMFGPNGLFGTGGPFGDDGRFGEDGPFGRNGPFGKDGPFGPKGPFGADGPFGGGGGKGGRRRGRMFGQGELRLTLLKLVADEVRHGYELIKAIEAMTGGSYAPSPGTVYPTLSLLADEGAIGERDGDDGGGRKSFAATDAGRAELADRAEEVDAIMARLARIGAHEDRSDRPELRRAMHNLGNVLRDKARTGVPAGAAMDAIVDLIDETARRIERL